MTAPAVSTRLPAEPLDPPGLQKRPDDQDKNISAKRPVGASGHPLNWTYRLLAFCVLSVWFTLFGLGILVDTLPYQLRISPDNPQVQEAAKARDIAPDAAEVALARAVLIVTFFSTPTNIAILCSLAGLIGALGSKASLHPGQEEDRRDQENPYVSALIRAFATYLAFVSGALFFAENPFAAVSPGHYVKLAGTMSLISFVVSYDAQLFGRVLDRASARLRESPKDPPDDGNKSDSRNEEEAPPNDHIGVPSTQSK